MSDNQGPNETHICEKCAAVSVVTGPSPDKPVLCSKCYHEQYNLKTKPFCGSCSVVLTDYNSHSEDPGLCVTCHSQLWLEMVKGKPNPPEKPDWHLWNEFRQDAERLPIEAPPCPGCTYWYPHRKYTPEGVFAGVTLCNLQDSPCHDFSCFRKREVKDV